MTGSTPATGVTKDVEIAIPLTYLISGELLKCH